MSMHSLFGPPRAVPPELRSNFLHLYLDIAWFAVLAASAQSFVAVYAARQGASAFEIGLLSAGPAAVNLALTLPAGRWLQAQAIAPAVFWSAALMRFFYLLWVPLPWLLAPKGQVWALVGLTLLMNIPGTALAVGFNALFADAVPPEWRAYVSGVRNAVMSVVFIVVSLLCGQILVRLPFPDGYAVVFGLGFLGAAMSTLHLRFVVPTTGQATEARRPLGLRDRAWPGGRGFLDLLRSGSALRTLARGSGSHLLRIDALRGPYGRLIAVLSGFYLAVYLAVPLFALYWVDELHLTDGQISLGNALFYVTVFLGSTQLASLARRLGNQRVTAIGAALMAGYPLLMSLSQGLWLFLAASAIGGLGWSMVGGALTNYLLERIPEHRRPEYLAWYNLAVNGALLTGALLGPLVAGLLSPRLALGVFAALRAGAALAILILR